MPLIYVPYVPNRHEHFILRNRRILADQMEYLLAGVPKTRLRWRITRGAWFHNMLTALEFDGRRARIRFDRTVADQDGVPHLQPVCEAELS